MYLYREYFKAKVYTIWTLRVRKEYPKPYKVFRVWSSGHEFTAWGLRFRVSGCKVSISGRLEKEELWVGVCAGSGIL